VSGHVFISYSRTDRAYVEELAAQLAFAGLGVWYDYDIEIGSRFDSVIQAQIDGCAAIVVVLSPDAVRSEWVAREVGYAESQRKPILPLMRTACDLPILLVGLNYENVTGGAMPGRAFEARLTRLVNAAPDAALSGTRDEPARRSAPARGRDWPDPSSIRTDDGIRPMLRRTWIRAGSPDPDEVSRRTGGLLTTKDAQQNLDIGYWIHMDRWPEMAMMFDAWGLPDDVIEQWRRTLARIARRERRRLYRGEGVWAVTVGVLVSALAYLIGGAVPRLGSAGFTTGNWWAVAISAVVLVIGMAWSSLAIDMYVRRHAERIYLVYAVAFGIGWLLTPHVHGFVPHAVQITRDWLGWRF
jgi:TIR domain